MKAYFTLNSKNNNAMNFIKSSLIVSSFFSILFSLVVSILFAGFNISFEELGILLVKSQAVCWLFLVTINLMLTIPVWVFKKINAIQFISLERKQLDFKIIPVIIVSIVLLYSCNGQPLAGISKDLNTGMVTTYSKIKPGQTVIAMNEEKIGHTKIPLGEKFVVINEEVKGLSVKDNKVSIGCSLMITDNKGTELLNEADLFKDGAGIYDKENANYLKCTVSTGKPMNIDQEYKVAIKFWDKFGEGTIENKFTITIIDVP